MDEIKSMKKLDEVVARTFTTPERVEELTAILQSARKQGAKEALSELTSIIEELYEQIDG